MKILIGIISFILWSLVSIQWYVCGIKGLCNDEKLSENGTDKIVEPPVSTTESKKDSASTIIYSDTTNNTTKSESDDVISDESKSTFSIEKMAINFHFAKTKATITNSQKDSLRTVVKEINATDASLILIGRADTVGTEQKNMEVGRLRAEFMKNVFVSLGLDENKIITKSEGENQVISNNPNNSDMKNSRRVDIIVKSNN